MGLFFVFFLWNKKIILTMDIVVTFVSQFFKIGNIIQIEWMNLASKIIIVLISEILQGKNNDV